MPDQPTLHVHDQPTQGMLPPKMERIVGRRVYRAWQGATTLYLRLEGGFVVYLSAVCSDIPDRPYAVLVTIGDEKPGAEFGFLDEQIPQTPHTRDLRGKKVTGLEGNILQFDSRYGVEFTPDSIHWVRKR